MFQKKIILIHHVIMHFQIVFKNMANRPYNIFPNGLASVQPVKKRGKTKFILHTVVYINVLKACGGKLNEYYFLLIRGNTIYVQRFVDT